MNKEVTLLSNELHIVTNKSAHPPPILLHNDYFHNRSLWNNDSSSVLTLDVNASDTAALFRYYPPALLDSAAVLCIVFAVVGIVGNFLSIVALSKCPRLRNATTVFIINLCAADFLFCCFSLPLSAVTFLERGWNYGETLCKLFPLFRYSNGAVSLFTVIAITVNRYVLVVHPRRYQGVYRPIHIAIMIAVIWGSALVLLSLPLFEVWGRFGYDPKVGTCTILRLDGRSPKMFLYTAAFGLPSLVFVACYSRIFWVVRSASKKVHKPEPCITFTSKQGMVRRIHHAQVSPSLSPKRRKRELKVLRVMLVVFVTFVLCYFPVSFVKVFKREDDLPVLNIFGYLAVYFSNCINPVIYVIMSEEYRRAYLELFGGGKLRRSSTIS